MKKAIRALGIDDSPFSRDAISMLIGTVTRAPNYIEGILTENFHVDGMDVTEKMMTMINKTRFKDQIKVIFTNGITFGGFNVLDLDSLYENVRIPVVTVSRKDPDFEKIEMALKKHFSDWKIRLELMKKHKIQEITVLKNPVYVQVHGIEKDELYRVLKLFTVRGALPEPIRISHIIANGLYFGESHTKA